MEMWHLALMEQWKAKEYHKFTYQPRRRRSFHWQAFNLSILGNLGQEIHLRLHIISHTLSLSRVDVTESSWVDVSTQEKLDEF